MFKDLLRNSKKKPYDWWHRWFFIVNTGGGHIAKKLYDKTYDAFEGDIHFGNLPNFRTAMIGGIEALSEPCPPEEIGNEMVIRLALRNRRIIRKRMQWLVDHLLDEVSVDPEGSESNEKQEDK